MGTVGMVTGPVGKGPGRDMPAKSRGAEDGVPQRQLRRGWDRVCRGHPDRPGRKLADTGTGRGSEVGTRGKGRASGQGRMNRRDGGPTKWGV